VVVRARPEAAKDPRRHDDLVVRQRETAERLPEDPLGEAVGVDVRGVEEVDARLEGDPTSASASA